MKKIGLIALLLALVMCLSVVAVGCNAQNDDADQGTTGDTGAGDDTTEGGDDTTDEGGDDTTEGGDDTNE